MTELILIQVDFKFRFIYEGLNSEYSFFKTGLPSMTKHPGLTFYLIENWREIETGFLFPISLTQSEQVDLVKKLHPTCIFHFIALTITYTIHASIHPPTQMDLHK